MTQKIVFLLLFMTLTACSKPDPQPELKDAIYLDISDQMSAVEKNIADGEKKLEEADLNLKKVVLQTGQIKYAEKRRWDAVRAVDQLKQQLKYWIVRKDQRRDYVRQKSMKQFYTDKQPWSDSAELETYLSEKRLRQARNEWDAKGRREAFLSENNLKLGAGPKKEPAPAGH